MKKTSTKKTGIILAVMVLFALIVALGVYQMQSSSQPIKKKPASEYFEIVEPTVDEGEFKNPPVSEGGSYQNSSVLVVYGLSFKLKAVGGDAHFVVVKSWARADAVAIDAISKGQSEFVSQMTSTLAGMAAYKNQTTGKFQFTIGIDSKEAEGDIVFDLPE